MTRLRTLAVCAVAAGLVAAPLSDASARCWGWRCGPGPLIALPFLAAGAVVAGAAAVATAPFAAVAPAPAPYYAPPAYYPPPAYYAPPAGYYYPAPGYYYGR